VRESSDLDEDLLLLQSGQTLFAEDGSTSPGNHADSPRIVPNGQIFAEGGSVTLLVGDDVNLHQNSEILAAEGIAVYGDANATDGVLSSVDPDAGYGTNMLLRGRIIAGADVTPGSQSGGSPVGTAAPTLTAPVHLTEFFGNTDVDTIQF